MEIAQASQRRVNALFVVSLTAGLAFQFSSPLRHGGNPLGWAEDDLYYYLVAARNLADGLGSTFGGLAPTNGYHPLYLLLLWMVSKFTTNLHSVFGFLAVIDTLSALSIFLSARAFIARRVDTLWTANLCAVFLLLLFRSILCTQMEVILALPLAFFLLRCLDHPPAEISPKRWGAIGFVAAVMVLARLDSVLLVGLLATMALGTPRYRATMTLPKVFALSSTFLAPLAIYALVNEVVFHRLMPISGAAKQLKTTHGFAWRALAISVTPEVAAMFGLNLIILIVLVARWKRLAAEERVTYTATLLFPFLHWGLNLWVSDWRLWPWYTYSLRLSMLIVLSFCASGLRTFPTKTWWLRLQVPLTAVILLFAITRPYRISSKMMDTASSAEQIALFAQTHPGRYAMGDRSGMVGLILGQPLLQTEGLMMDDAYLAHIRNRDPLRDVLKLYGINYYISHELNAQASSTPTSKCYEAREPAQAGPDSPSMAATFCDPPAFTINSPAGGRTLIF